MSNILGQYYIFKVSEYDFFKKKIILIVNPLMNLVAAPVGW